MLTHDQVGQLFPDADILVVTKGALAGQVLDNSLRSILVDAGLPDSLLDVVEIDRSIVKRVRTVGDFYKSGAERAPGGSDGLLYLGLAGDGLLAVDAETGETFLVDVSTGVRRLSSTFEAFLRTLGAISNAVSDYWTESGTIDSPTFKVRLVRITAQTVARVDPDVGETAERSWQELASDIAIAAG